MRPVCQADAEVGRTCVCVCVLVSGKREQNIELYFFVVVVEVRLLSFVVPSKNKTPSPHTIYWPACLLPRPIGVFATRLMHAVHLLLSPPRCFAPAPMPIDVKCTFDCDKWILSSDVAWPQLHWQAEVIHNHTETHSTAHTHAHSRRSTISEGGARGHTTWTGVQLTFPTGQTQSSPPTTPRNLCKPACAGGSPPRSG